MLTLYIVVYTRSLKFAIVYFEIKRMGLDRNGREAWGI